MKDMWRKGDDRRHRSCDTALMTPSANHAGSVAQRIVPNIWCNGNAEEVGNFYAGVFENASAEIEARYPETGLLDFQEPLAGQPLTIALTISGYRFTLVNAGDEFAPNAALSFMINFDPLLFDGDEDLARASLRRLWQGLADGGSVLMPLGEYPFSALYGWVEDRHGVHWQLILTDPAGDPRPFILPVLLFGGPVQNHAGEAVGHYLDVFTDLPGGAEIGMYALYPEQHGPAEPGAVQFSDFCLGDQWFVAMDSAAAQDTTFSPGVSLEVQCDDQAQIDRVWDALSAVPEAEQCGWLTDRFGVSWQVVPANMAELMERPGAFERMLSMKKLIIADL